MDNKNVKQIIIMRKDLKMRRGKEIAQAAHASMGILFQMMEKTAPTVYEIDMPEDMLAWKEGPFTKICVSVQSEEELVEIINKAKELGYPAILITDNGTTEFNGVPTITCGAIGPVSNDKLKGLTDHLPLY